MALLALAAVRAIRAFQTNQGLPVTGLIDRKVLTGGSSDENERAFEVVVRDPRSAFVYQRGYWTIALNFC
jgi:Putative peptidoglycan binding domain